MEERFLIPKTPRCIIAVFVNQIAITQLIQSFNEWENGFSTLNAFQTNKQNEERYGFIHSLALLFLTRRAFHLSLHE